MTRSRRINKVRFFLSFFLLAVGAFALTPRVVGAGELLTQRPVVIIGDSQHRMAVHQKLIDAIIKENPIAVFSLGDQVEDGNSLEDWKVFNETTASLRAIARYYPALGNHERNSPLYYKNFGFPEDKRWYAVQENKILFIVLDSNDPLALSENSPQYRWLKDVLATQGPQNEHIVVLFHHPLFTTSASHDEDEKHWRTTALPLFEKYHVDLVVSGHCHNYERSLYQGIYYIVSGGGGSSLFGQSRQSPYAQVFASKYHFSRLVNDHGTLRLNVIDVDGKLIDALAIPFVSRF